MRRWVKLFGRVIAVALLLATGLPLIESAHAHGPHQAAPALTLAANAHSPVVHGPVAHGPVAHGPVAHGPVEGHHDSHAGLCAALCVAPLVASTNTQTGGAPSASGVRFYLADEWADSLLVDGLKRPPRA
jgi:hypothetical protein